MTKLTGDSNHLYGNIDVRLSICRLISELLVRIPSGQLTHLDETVLHLSETNVPIQEQDTYGSLLLYEFGCVFKALYLSTTNPTPVK